MSATDAPAVYSLSLHSIRLVLHLSRKGRTSSFSSFKKTNSRLTCGSDSVSKCREWEKKKKKYKTLGMWRETHSSSRMTPSQKATPTYIYSIFPFLKKKKKKRRAGDVASIHSSFFFFFFYFSSCVKDTYECACVEVVLVTLHWLGVSFVFLRKKGRTTGHNNNNTIPIDTLPIHLSGHALSAFFFLPSTIRLYGCTRYF